MPTVPEPSAGSNPSGWSTVMRDYIQPMARKLGIQKKMSCIPFDTHFPRFSRAMVRM